MIATLKERVSQLKDEIKETEKEIKRLLKKQNNAECIECELERFLFPMDFNRLCKSQRVSYVVGTSVTFSNFCLNADVVMDKYVMVGNRKAYSIFCYRDILDKLLEGGRITKQKQKVCLHALDSVKPTRSLTNGQIIIPEQN